MDCGLLKGKRFVCREWAFSKLLHCVETRPQAKTCGTLILGGPGSGKTALCCEIRWPTASSSRRTQQSQQQSQPTSVSRHELRKHELHSRLLAAHFCEAHNVDSLAVLSFVRNVREQVLRDAHVRSECARNQPYAIKCSTLFDEAVQRGDADDALFHGLVALLLHISPPERNRFILVDSLDESFLCDDTLASLMQPTSPANATPAAGGVAQKAERSRSRTIAELLSRHHAMMPGWLSLICTVRKQSRSVTRLFTGFRTITLDDTKKTHVVRDVQQFILHRIEADDGLRALLNNRDSIDMLNALHIKSNACFLYLETVLNGIQDSFIALREVKDIPGTLNGLYLWLCQRLFSKRSLFQQVQPILNAIVASRAPLSESDLFTALWSRDHRLEYTHFTARLELLGRLLVYGPPPHTTCTDVKHGFRFRPAGYFVVSTAPGNDTLLLFHHSFAEWLLDVKLCTRKYLCNVQDGHAMLAMARTLTSTRPTQSAHLIAEYVLHVCKSVVDSAATRRGTLSAASSTILLQHAGLSLAQLGLSNQNGSAASRKPNASSANGSGTAVSANVDTATETSNSLSVSVLETPASITQSTYVGGQLTRAHIALWFLFSGAELSLLKRLELADCDSDDLHPDPDVATSKRAVDALMDRFMTSFANTDDPNAYPNLENQSSRRSKPTDAGRDTGHGNARRSDPHETEATGDIKAIARQIQEMTASVNETFADGGPESLSSPTDALSAGVGRKTSTPNEKSNPENSASGSRNRIDSQTLPAGPASRRPHANAKPATSASSSTNVNEIARPASCVPAPTSETQAAASRVLLCAAAAQGDLHIVRAVVEAAELQQPTERDLVRELVNIRDRNGATPLGLAARHGHADVLEFLVSKGADLDVFDNDGWSALRAAAWAGNTAIVDALLRAGAKPNATGADRRTAIRAAAWNGHEDVLRLLLDAGADVNLADIEGRTPLIAAAYMGHVDIIELLIDAAVPVWRTKPSEPRRPSRVDSSRVQLNED